MANAGVMLKWDKPNPIALMENMKRAMRNRIIRKAIRTGSQQMRKDAKAAAPRDTNALRMSIGSIIRTGKRSGVTTGVVGARSTYIKKLKHKSGANKGKAIVRTRGKRKGESYEVQPSKYLHLVERGHRKRGKFGAPSAARVEGKPFMGPTMTDNWSNYERQMVGALKDEITRLFG